MISRNTYQIAFQVVELAVALWFPCCLWNCIQPETLWILNPRRILKKVKSNRNAPTDSFDNLMVKNRLGNERNGKLECWICYDTDKHDVLIQPCKCKGDVSIVHHECLKLWLMESNLSTKNIRCKVCNEYYQLSKGEIWLPDGLELNHYLKTLAVFFVMGSTVFMAYFLVRIFDYGYIRTISVGVATLIEYVCLKMLGVNLLSAYHKAKFAAIVIKGKILDENDHQLSIFRQSSLASSSEQLSTAHLSSSTSETGGDDYSNESLNDVESEIIQSLDNLNNLNHSGDHLPYSDNQFSQQFSQHSECCASSQLNGRLDSMICVKHFDDECRTGDRTEQI